MGAVLGDLAVLDRLDTVGHAHGGEAVRDEHGHASGQTNQASDALRKGWASRSTPIYGN